MVQFREDLAHFENYKVARKVQHNLGDNENRVMDWSSLAQEAVLSMDPSVLTYYGDNRYEELLKAYAAYLHVPVNYLVQGVGSDQMVHMIVTTFLKAGEVFLTVNPDFFMYQVYNEMHGVHYASYDLAWQDDSLFLDPQLFLDYANQVGAKVIMLSNPNNPSSIEYPSGTLEAIVAGFDGVVVIDEAYIDFAKGSSFVPLIDRYPNLIVLRTLSKAFGLAGLRLGFAVTNPTLAREIDKVLPPYSMPNIVAEIGKVALEKKEAVEESVQTIKETRDDFIAFLKTLPDMLVLPSATNFITFKAPYCSSIFEDAQKEDFLFKYYTSGRLAGFIRLSVGRKDEMEQMKGIIQKVLAKG
ncbi:pyridoxal phosphate-dependent aminotransferase [Streptococcus sp. DD13]|uniref:pyridoxal phosphate-dependent aminotransferase n=1 Tax=Streptococcus sp. DD13 TaxID=1777881 RepID=UPI00079437D7|nr:aminotransferase class I/II-fold pyridoxal phosphate-dependent enzyme [Streptococcus sp. DD13]KXT78894.1 Histidinol-phosphate aminotransferase [Streptococcus sp. DD13]